MKRGADSYITKDSEPDDDIEEVPGEGFQKADDTVLATRKIRALPKRSIAGTPPPAASNGTSTPELSSAPTPKFNGFSGFGTPSGSFSFTPPLSPSSSFTNNSSFHFSTSSSTPSTAPTVAPTASTTAKAFASFLGGSSTVPPKSTSAPESVLQETPLHSTSTPSADDPAALNYYKSLRGLNLSLLSAITKAIEDDPFNDIVEVLERYKSLRLDVQNEFDQRPKVSAPAPPTVRSKPTAMPAPPPAFSVFGPASPKSTTTSGGNGGFIPTPPTTASSTSGFSFPAPAPTSTTTSTTPSGFSFATPPASQSSSPAPSNPFASSSSAPSTFGASIFNPSAPSPFGVSSKSTSSPAPLTFGDTTPTSTSNPFAITPSSGSGGISDKPASSNLFGTSPPSSKTGAFGGFGGFGKPAGSIGNPVGFGFGSPSGTPEVEGSDTTEKAGSAEDTKDQSTKGETKSPPMGGGMFATSPHDDEGEGEEQEDTIYSVKLKAFRLKKGDEKGGAGWAELGYGVLRLKKHKETQARRILLRNSSSGKININFNIYSGMKPSQAKKSLTFIGHDNGVSQTYNVRLQNEDQAVRLKEALEKEIASVKSSSDS